MQWLRQKLAGFRSDPTQEIGASNPVAENTTPPQESAPTGRSPTAIASLRAEVERRSPWYSYYDFGDRIEAVSPWPQVNRQHFQERADRLFAALAKHVRPSECSLLDVGCSDGYFSIDAARRGFGRVVGVDFREDSIERARFAAGVLGIDSVEFRVGNVYEPADLGDPRYDVVICQGLFYHLSDPVRALRNVRARTGNVAFFAGWTVIRQDPVFYVRAEKVTDIRHGDNEIILVPTAAGIRKTLELVGYKTITDVNPWTAEPDWTSDQGDWREYIAFV